jgi:hypothetical protein
MVPDDKVIRYIGNGADESRVDPEHDGSESPVFLYSVQVFAPISDRKGFWNGAY